MASFPEFTIYKDFDPTHVAVCSKLSEADIAARVAATRGGTWKVSEADVMPGAEEGNPEFCRDTSTSRHWLVEKLSD